ncbi:MAG: MotA/TolQ/ExbB proton channel family protein [Proteobacteria bacterium]|nr:MAG: MotA/TolQ/ExbB proton channel family protein [Pseudomonadota bacterium]
MSRFSRTLPTEFIYDVFALIVAVIIVHAVYVTTIRPQASAIMAYQSEQMRADPNFVPERSIYVIVKDYEQEACFILMLWAFAIMGYKGWSTSRERRLLATDLIHVPDGMRILPEDTREYARQVESLPPQTRRLLLPRALLAALSRFGATRNVQDVSDAARSVCQSEAERLDSELSMVRYIAWAIPAIGFIGTVRGIGDALAQAHKAVTGDIAGVTEGLGVAFNSTLIALLISIVIMFLLHQLQLAQERLVLDTETYLDQQIIRHMQAK